LRKHVFILSLFCFSFVKGLTPDLSCNGMQLNSLKHLTNRRTNCNANALQSCNTYGQILTYNQYNNSPNIKVSIARNNFFYLIIRHNKLQKMNFKLKTNLNFIIIFWFRVWNWRLNFRMKFSCHNFLFFLLENLFLKKRDLSEIFLLLQNRLLLWIKFIQSCNSCKI
jgi:hypothetical protein